MSDGGFYVPLQVLDLHSVTWLVEQEGGYCIQRPFWAWWGLNRDSFSSIGRSTPVWQNT